MWISSIFLSMIADWLISTKKCSIGATRKIFNTIGQFGPAICLAVVSYTGCNRILTVFLLTIGISLNGGIYSGFKVSRLFEGCQQSSGIIDTDIVLFADKSSRHFPKDGWHFNGNQ